MGILETAVQGAVPCSVSVTLNLTVLNNTLLECIWLTKQFKLFCTNTALLTTESLATNSVETSINQLFALEDNLF